jgi:hypothetical protein
MGEGEQETAEQVVQELGIEGYDPQNKAHTSMIGVITKLRGERRTLTEKVTKLEGAQTSLTQELTGFRQGKKESEIISSLLGTELEISDMDKFSRYKPKNFGESGWEDQFKQTVKDFAAPKKKSDEPPAPTKKQDEEPTIDKAKEAELIKSTLGDKKIKDQKVFDEALGKLKAGDSWEADLKKLVGEHAVDSKKEERDASGGAYKPRRLRGASGGTEEMKTPGLQTGKKLGPTARLILATENPDAYNELRQKEGRK